jgi:N-acetylmuramoyl-L-alanine amidase
MRESAQGKTGRASPNHGPRRPGASVDILLLHYTGMPSAEGALSWLCDPRSGVSSHWFVFEDGRTVQLVPEDRRAHHAGVSFWQGETDINSRSIGIEIANPGHEFGYSDFPDAQVAALIELCRGILSRHPIPPERVLAHSDVAPERKRDPGERFPWKALADAGIGRWVAPAPVEEGGPVLAVGAFGGGVAALQADLARVGYRVRPTGVFDWQTELCVAAFQRHFRQARVDGMADASTRETLRRLLA